MLIGILSDTHDQVARTRRAVSMLTAAGAESLIHCGDLTIPDVVDEFAGVPTSFVFGNCDYDQADLRRAMKRIGAECLELGGLITRGDRRIAVTHGHSHAEFRRLAALEPDYLFSGHTHHRRDDREGKTRFINPGALYRASSWTVALLDLAADDLKTLTLAE
jgi:putative phosphoesterase